MTQTTITYTLWHDSPEGPVIFYVGESIDPSTRLKQHRRDAADPMNSKEAYVYLREHNIKAFDMLTVEDTTEDSLYTALTLSGVKLYNSKRGIASSTKKKRDTSWSDFNKAAEARIRDQAEASGRRTRLHSERQSLTKSEITRQRFLDEAPTVEGLLACQWHDCPPELVNAKAAKSAERATYCKWGDYTVVVALRKKDRQSVCVARHPKKGAKYANGAGYMNIGKESILELLIDGWDNPYPGWLKHD